MFFQKYNYDKKRNVKISLEAFFYITNLDYFLEHLGLALYIIICGLIGLIINDLIYWIAYGSILVLFSSLLIYKKYRDLEKIRIFNYEDYQRSEKILNFFNEFSKKMPEILTISSEKKITENGWRPTKVTFFSDQTITAKLKGDFSGDWNGFFSGSFDGIINGKIEGDVKQNLIDQGVIVILEKDNKVLRLIGLNINICKEYFRNTLENYYGSCSFSGEALNACINRFLDTWNPNPSNVFDRIDSCLKNPFEERPTVTIHGVSLGKGVIGAYSIALNDEKPEIVFPIELIFKLLKDFKEVIILEKQSP